MLQPQRTKLLGDLYYGDDTPQYVAPPIKEMKELGAAKEQDYLLTKDRLNEIDKIKRTLPYTEQSSAVYNEWQNKIDSALTSVNADNYEDKVLDVTQVANDLYNKWGGNELVKQAGEYQAEMAKVDKAVEDGVITNPEKAAWKKQQIAQGTKSVYQDENGYFKAPKVGTTAIVPDESIGDRVNEVMKGWDNDIAYTKNADGTIQVNNLVPGYLSTLNKDTITQEELYNAALTYVKSDPKMEAYLNDEVAFQMRNTNPTVESIFAVAKPEHLEAIFGKKGITMEEAQMKVASGEVDVKEQLGVLVKKGIVDQAINLPIQKYSRTKEKLDTMQDTLLIEELKFNASARLKAMEEQVVDNSLVTIEPFMAKAELHPSDITALNTRKTGLQDKRKTLQATTNNLNKALQKGEPGVTADQIVENNEALTRLDVEIKEIYEQEKQISATFAKEARMGGVDIQSEYTNILPKAREVAIAKNREVLVNSNSAIDISKNVITKNGKEYIVFKGRNGAADKTVLATEVLNNKASGISRGVGEDSKKYVYRSAEDTSNFNKANNVVDDSFFDERGRPNQSTFIGYKPSNDRTTGDPYVEDFYRTPTDSEYTNMMAFAYNNEDRTSLMDNHLEGYTSGKLIIPKSGLKPLDKIQKERGMFNSPVSRNLSSIFVTGETTKSELKLLQNLEDADNESFRKTHSQYSVKVGGKTLNLADAIEEMYGLPNISAEYIDWDKTTSKMLLSTDREFGQEYGLNIVLTKEGREKVADMGTSKSEGFTKESDLKLVGVNTTKPVKAEQAKIRNALFVAYGQVAKDDSDYGVEVRSQMGRLYADQIPAIGGEIDRLNLYTVPPGEKKELDIMGTKYLIRTTDKDLESNDILDVDFHIGVNQNGQELVMAQNAKGETDWYDASEVEKSNQAILDSKGDAVKLAEAKALRLSKVSFESPNDIKAFMGSKYLEVQHKQQQLEAQQLQAQNPYTQFRMSTSSRTSGGNSYTVEKNTITSNDYKTYLNMVKTMHGTKGDKQITLMNNTTGKQETIAARVDSTELVNLKPYLAAGTVAVDNNYPYVHKSISNSVVQTLKTHGLTFTGGFRGEETHSGQAEASDNSLHKYGYSVDFRADKAGLAFYDNIIKNQDLMDQLGIAKAYKHTVGGVTHIHTEYKPQTL
jgi:hypothetical protein